MPELWQEYKLVLVVIGTASINIYKSNNHYYHI